MTNTCDDNSTSAQNPAFDDTCSEWKVIPLGRIARPRLGGNYQNTQARTTRPLIKMGNLARITIDLSTLEYIPDAEDVLSVHRLNYGDVLLNTRNTPDLVGKVSIWRDELLAAYYNSNIMRLEFDPRYCGSSTYFGYALNTDGAIRKIRSLAIGTTSVSAIYARDLFKLEIAVPPKAEQRAIAKILTDTDDLVEILERYIAKKRDIKTAAMQQLLTGRTRLPGFTGSWNGRSLGAVCSFRNGEYIPRSHYVHNGRFVIYGSNSEMGRTDSPLVEEAHVVMAAVGAYAGAVRHSPSAAWINNNAFGIIPEHGELDAAYLYYLLLNCLRLDQVVAGSGQPYVSRPALSSQRFSVPSLDEQCAIAKVLSDMDKEIELLGKRLKKTRDIKKGLMQELLTGRTRLSDGQIEELNSWAEATASAADLAETAA